MLGKLFHRTNAAVGLDVCPREAKTETACYVFTIKKSGSHLIRNVLRELNLRCIDCLAPGSAAQIDPPRHAGAPAAFVLSLERPSIVWRGNCQQGKAKIIFNLRDPRAVFLSLLDFYDWNVPLGTVGLHTVEFRRAACRNAFKSREELAMALIDDEELDDDPYTPWLNFRRSRALLHNPSVLKVRFEELAATPDAGPHDEEHPVARICDYLGLEPQPNPEEVIRKAVGVGSITKHVGDPDRWRQGLSPAIVAAFMAKHGDIVREYGYPNK